MKKFLIASAALFAMLSTSCQKQGVEVSSNEYSNVTFVVETPEIATRAFGDGTIANDLYYGIYDEAGNLISAISKVDDENCEEINMQKVVELRLVTGNTYSMIFWADNADDVCDVDFVNKTMTFAPTTSNIEAYDAFYAYEAPFKVTGDTSKTIVLRRPFAQLNIGTDDIELASAAGLDIATSQIKLKTWNTLNLVDGSVSNPTEFTYEFNAIPEGETFPVVGYEYIAMNYLLVAKDKELVDIEFSYNDGGNYIRNYTFVPVQRNYRTNIIGSILTSAVDITVVIDPIFEKPDYYVYDAFEFGGEITLTQDFEIGHPLVVKKNAVLNLNGKTIKNNAKNTDTDVIIVEEGASLTINGDGTIEAVSGNDGYAIVVEGTLVINDGTYKAGLDADNDGNCTIYARGNGNVIINGGKFGATEEDKATYVLNIKDANRATANIEVRGGEFKYFNPADNSAEGSHTSFLATGYKVEKNGDVYTVVAE